MTKSLESFLYNRTPQVSPHLPSLQDTQTSNFQEMTFAMRGNTKPFGKRLSPCAETPNHSGKDFCQAWKLQTFWETTFAMRGNTKPFGK